MLLYMPVISGALVSIDIIFRYMFANQIKIFQLLVNVVSQVHLQQLQRLTAIIGYPAQVNKTNNL